MCEGDWGNLHMTLKYSNLFFWYFISLNSLWHFQTVVSCFFFLICLQMCICCLLFRFRNILHFRFWPGLWTQVFGPFVYRQLYSTIYSPCVVLMRELICRSPLATTREWLCVRGRLPSKFSTVSPSVLLSDLLFFISPVQLG